MHVTADSARNYTDEELVRDYTLAWTGQGDAAHSWASDELDHLAWKQPERAWPVILSIIAGGPSDLFLAIVAAGPLEDLLCEHGPAFITRVEEEARRDSHFRHALAGVWGSSRMAADVHARVRVAVGDETL
jgi:hypothetical protein